MSDRIESISRHLSFLLRHAPTKPAYQGKVIFDQDGFVGLDLLHDVCARVRKLAITRADIEEICSPADENKARSQRIPGQGENILVRAYQGHSHGSIRDDQSLKFLPTPGPLFHATTFGSLQNILPDGLKKMDRSAIHLIDLPIDNRKSLYLTSRKPPYILVIDGDTATDDGGHAFFRTLNSAVLSDGDTVDSKCGTIQPQFIVALYAFMQRRCHGGFPTYCRLDLESAIKGDVPIKHFTGSDDGRWVPRMDQSPTPVISPRRSFSTMPVGSTIGREITNAENSSDSTRLLFPNLLTARPTLSFSHPLVS